MLLNVTTENQKMADERIPFLLDVPLKFRGVAVAPILEAVNLRSYLATGLITAAYRWVANPIRRRAKPILMISCLYASNVSIIVLILAFTKRVPIL